MLCMTVTGSADPSCSSAPWFCFPLSHRVGHPSCLKIWFVLFWQWWEEGNWMERRSAGQNTPRRSSRWGYMVSALVDLSSIHFLNPLPAFSFHLLTEPQRFPLFSSLLFHSVPLCLHHFLSVCSVWYSLASPPAPVCITLLSHLFPIVSVLPPVVSPVLPSVFVYLGCCLN